MLRVRNSSEPKQNERASRHDDNVVTRVWEVWYRGAAESRYLVWWWGQLGINDAGPKNGIKIHGLSSKLGSNIEVKSKWNQ